MKPETHVKLVGHLHFLLQAMSQPMWILANYDIVRTRDKNKENQYVFNYHFVEPKTGTLVPCNVDHCTFLGLSTFGRPVSPRLWDRVTALCGRLEYADDDVVDYVPMGPYFDILDSMHQALALAKRDLQDLDGMRERIGGIESMLMSIPGPEDDGYTITGDDLIEAFGENVSRTRYRLYKTDAGVELIKALKMVRHPKTRRDFAQHFARLLAEVNPQLVTALRQIK